MGQAGKGHIKNIFEGHAMNRTFNRSGWSDNDIRKSYSQAKDKDNQLKILVHMTLLNRFEILEIVGETDVIKEKEKVQGCYDKGMTDIEIAKECGATSDDIYQWRKTRNLPKNEKQKHTEILESVDEAQPVHVENKEPEKTKTTGINKIIAKLEKEVAQERENSIDQPPPFEVTPINDMYLELARLTVELLNKIWNAFPDQIDRTEFEKHFK
jgi:hypothetical protein